MYVFVQRQFEKYSFKTPFSKSAETMQHCGAKVKDGTGKQQARAPYGARACLFSC
jgi:hypothetical protein